MSSHLYVRAKTKGQFASFHYTHFPQNTRGYRFDKRSRSIYIYLEYEL